MVIKIFKMQSKYWGCKLKSAATDRDQPTVSKFLTLNVLSLSFQPQFPCFGPRGPTGVSTLPWAQTTQLVLDDALSCSLVSLPRNWTMTSIFSLSLFRFQWLEFFPEKSNCIHQARQILTVYQRTSYLRDLYFLFHLPKTLFSFFFFFPHSSIQQIMESKETEGKNLEALPHISLLFAPLLPSGLCLNVTYDRNVTG